MPLRVLSLWLCWLLAGPLSLPGWALAPVENRVGGSPAFSPVPAPAKVAQPLGTRPENPAAGYDSVPGVHKNLYAFVGNDPVRRVDPFGRETYANAGLREKFDCVNWCGVTNSRRAAELANQALAQAQQRFPEPNSLHNGPGDAWRHCFWSCEMARALGQRCAKIIGDFHEDAGDRAGQPLAEKKMDLHNNRAGRNAASETGNCADLCQRQLDNGALETIQ